MNFNRTVSIIIPTYNRGKLITRAVQSVLEQTYDKIEIIVIDDGSTDETEIVLREFKDKIQYMRSPHKGTAYARNIGMRSATGKYIAFLDSDDVYLPYKIELQVEFMEDHPSIGMVCTEFSGKYENGKFDEYLLREYHPIWKKKAWSYEDVFSEKGEYKSYALNKRISFFSGNIFKYMLHDALIATNTILFEKKILELVGYQNTGYLYAQEYEFSVRICKHFDIAFLNIPTYVLHFHNDQATSFLNENYLADGKEVEKKIQNSSVYLQTVIDWGLNDRTFYRENKQFIDDQVAGLNFLIGKNWLMYGDIHRAREYLYTSYRFKKLNARLYSYLLISMMPEKIRQSVLQTLRKMWSAKAGTASN